MRRWLARQEAGWQGSRGMQVIFVVGLEHAVTKLDSTALDGLTRIGPQDDTTFIRSAAALNRSWNELSARWPRLAIGSAATSAMFGHLGLSNSRTMNCR